MKKIIAISLLAVPFVFAAPGSILSEAPPPNPLDGKIIALDSGHGGSQLGAQYPPNSGLAGDIFEKEINLVTVHALAAKLTADGAHVVLTQKCDETVTGRRARVNIAKDNCADFDLDLDSNPDNRKCDLLVSNHHNGNVDALHDGSLAIYNNPADLVPATFLHDQLLNDLFDNDSAYDDGYAKGGYGMTVYFTPAALTEAYFVTNNCEAELFRPGTITAAEKTACAVITSANGSAIYNFPAVTATTTFNCTNPDESSYSVEYSPDRVDQEVDALYQGLYDYFDSISGDDEGDTGGGGNCPPAKEAKGKC